MRVLIGITIFIFSATIIWPAYVWLTLPPLLRIATAGDGVWDDGCPRPKFLELHEPLALSPEFDERLRHLFPPGTPAVQLSKELIRERFEIGAPCADDDSIKSASYDQKHYLVVKLHANAYWKVDADNKIVWTEGFIAYDGP